MLIKLTKFVIGILLIPVCVAFTQTLTYLLLEVSSSAAMSSLSPNSIGFMLGFLLWIMVFAVLPHPVKTYVFAHELTHIIWGVAAGAGVKGMKVTDQGGAVLLTKSNFIIALAPYFFPFYSICLIGAYGVVNLFFDIGAYHPFWMGLLGLTWAFHATFTLRMLKERQSDINAHGRLFSYTIIYIANLAIVLLLIVAMGSPTMRLTLTYLTNKLIDVFFFIEQFFLYLSARIVN